MKNITKIKAILSSLILIAFIIILLTGIGLYLSPSGRIARELSWNFLGFSKWQLENLHTIIGFTISALIIIHISLNYKIFFGGIKSIFKKQ